jgi:sialate O-acetylesterase
MEMSVPGVFDANSEIHDSANYPDLRLATVSKVIAKTPQQDVTSKSKYTWARSNPEAFGNATFSYFSATCFFFGRDLYTSLNGKIPIGLIVSCWGGQKVETFSSPDALADESCGGTVDKYSQTEEGISLESSFPNVVMDQPDDGFSNLDINIEPADLWNGMIHPLLPMRLAGALWYQGESNADNATSYACRFPAMISDWRVKFDLPDLSFFYVELAAYHPGSTWANVRAAQKAALKLDKVSFATAIDLGDPPSPDGAIHPRRKQEVGRRLSLSARAIQYEEAVVFQGPLPTSFHNSTTRGGDKTLTLNFDPDTSKGLHLHGSANCTTCCSDSMAFEVLDTSGTWTKVLGLSVQRPNKVILEIPVAQSTKILGVRYAWEPYPQCILYNGVGGPDDHQALAAAPFEICVNPSGQGSWTGRGCKTTDISNSR